MVKIFGNKKLVSFDSESFETYKYQVLKIMMILTKNRVFLGELGEQLLLSQGNSCRPLVTLCKIYECYSLNDFKINSMRQS